MKPTEQKIVDYFNKHPDTEQSTSEIQVALGIGQANCSRYLNGMVSMEILSRRKVGKQVFYSLFGEPVNIHTSKKSNVTNVTKSNTKKKSNAVTHKKVTPKKNIRDDLDFDFGSYKDQVLNNIETTKSKNKSYTIELPLVLLTEVLEDISSRKVKGFNLTHKKYNDKPYREVFETTLRLLKKKINKR